MKKPVTPLKPCDLVWLVLLLLTLLSFALAESQLRPELVTPLVIAGATLKSLLIGAVFMELLRAPAGLLAGFGTGFAVLGLSLVWLFSH